MQRVFPDSDYDRQIDNDNRKATQLRRRAARTEGSTELKRTRAILTHHEPDNPNESERLQSNLTSPYIFQVTTIQVDHYACVNLNGDECCAVGWETGIGGARRLKLTRKGSGSRARLRSFEAAIRAST